MSALIELKYFNTFWLKRIKSVADVAPGVERDYSSNSGAVFAGLSSLTNVQMNTGQKVTLPYLDTSGGGAGVVRTYSSYIVSRDSATQFTAADIPVGIGAP